MTENIVLHHSSALSIDGSVLAPKSSGRGEFASLRQKRAPEESNFYINPASAPTKSAQLVAKRVIDIIGAFGGLLVLAPLLILVAALIKIESRGPVFFRQIRTGRNDVPFEILKFRSMYTEQCDTSGVAQTTDNDPRITRLGKVLRKTNLDEIPQLWNVLIGDMSLVGPRPHVPDMLAAGRNYSDLVQGYEYRHLMRPGLTGLAQARGLRGPTTHRWLAIRRIVCDVEYIRNFSLMLDIKIMIRTAINELRGGTGF
ncbi:sugar transferase [Pararhizobium arenae]|uniref:sugar transferase n=1 Tax=Pararhizobium arenae TaxID=1856850 RepID=UPI0009FAF81B|nr:sugar transferase [Pararhizobium arenae]